MDFTIVGHWLHSSWSQSSSSSALVSQFFSEKTVYLCWRYCCFLARCQVGESVHSNQFGQVDGTMATRDVTWTQRTKKRKREEKEKQAFTLVILMLGTIEGAWRVGDGSWLWLPLVIEVMTGSPSTCSLSLAIALLHFWGALFFGERWREKAGATFGAFKFPTVLNTERIE